MLHLRLKGLRKDAGLKQTDMSEILGLSTRNYQRYESGDVDPPTSKTVFLADYFDVSLDYLVGRSDCPEVSR